MLSGFGEIFDPEKVDYSGDEPSNGEPTDDWDQGMDIDGAFYAVCYGPTISHFVTDFVDKLRVSELERRIAPSPPTLH